MNRVSSIQYLLTFLEGIITFVSPCLLPMLPIYISYFAGQENKGGKNRAVINSVGFVLGFTIVFLILGAFAGSIGSALKNHQVVVNIICGVILILFGLNFTEVIRLPFINNVKSFGRSTKNLDFFSSLIFGIVFSISWSPCVGTFLGSALMLAAGTGETVKGILMLLTYSLGLGIPFILSAFLINKLKTAFDFIKKHYRLINIGSGILLIILGVMVATGLINYLYSLI